MWDAITYPFPNFNRWGLRMDQLFHTTLYNGWNYLPMLRLHVTHISKTGLWYCIDTSHPSPVLHYDDVKMGAIASQITSLTIVCPTVYSNADHRKHQSAASLAFVRGIHRGPVNSPHKWPVMRKMFPFDDVIMSRIDKEELSKNIQTHLINLFIDPTDTSVDEEIPSD